MKSNPIGSLTDGCSFGTFGEILQFMLRSLFWLTFWPLLLSVARAQAETAAPRFEFGRPIFHTERQSGEVLRLSVEAALLVNSRAHHVRNP